jgi:hypothetical protein
VIDSSFLRLAQKYGLAPTPRTPQDLFTALQDIITPSQMELVQYLFTDPLQFQANPFAAIPAAQPLVADTGAVAAQEVPVVTAPDVLPGKDRASAQVDPSKADPTQPGATPPGPATNTNPAQLGSGSAYSGANHFNPDGTITLAPDDPDAARLVAQYPGLYKWAGQPAAATTTTPTPVRDLVLPIKVLAQPEGNMPAGSTVTMGPDGKTPVKLSDWALKNLKTAPA